MKINKPTDDMEGILMDNNIISSIKLFEKQLELLDSYSKNEIEREFLEILLKHMKNEHFFEIISFEKITELLQKAFDSVHIEENNFMNLIEEILDSEGENNFGN